MSKLPVLISDLGLILAAAGITTIIFKRIKQPLVLGYILAGLLVSSHFKYVPTVSDNENIIIWGEIGVIFLLFSLGLEFSFKKLVKVGGSSSITALVEILGMSTLGFFAGQLMGWKTMDSIFLGAVMSISSTTIVIRAFDELGVKHKKFASVVFGVLVVEDLATILIMVLLTTLAVSQQFAGLEMVYSIVKLVFFLILWFLAGIFIIPSLLKMTKKFMNDETLLVVSLALCLMMVLLAVKVGFSTALGAFIMGSILAETTKAEKIEVLIKPVKDLFGAIFFVSVGMLIDPKILLTYWQPVLIISILVIFGKLITVGGGALLSGQPLKTSVQTGASLTLIGEFSFIIASLGLTLNVTSDFLYPITVAVSAITTFTVPYMIKYADRIFAFLNRVLPKPWLAAINRYSTSAEGITTLSDWKTLLRSYLINTVINAVVLVAIVILASTYLKPFIQHAIMPGKTGNYVGVAISLLAMSPFLWALTVKRVAKVAYSHLWLNKKYSRGPLISLELLRIALGLFFIGFLMSSFFTTATAISLALLLTLVVMIVFGQRVQKFYERVESRFLFNLNAREAAQKQLQVLPWDSHLLELHVSPNSPLVGKTLVELAVRERFGVNIALIERGNQAIPTPKRDEHLYPYDKVMIIGSDEQLASIKPLFEVDEETEKMEHSFPKNDMSLQKVVVNSKSVLYQQSIRESNIREATQGLVVGIERDGKRILNPDSDLVFENDDIVWVVGNKRKIVELLG